jgi:hypothetical protein
LFQSIDPGSKSSLSSGVAATSGAV